MSIRRPPSFRQIDVTRALRAAKAAGLDVTRVEIDPRTGRIVIGAGTEQNSAPRSELDEWLTGHARQP